MTNEQLRSNYSKVFVLIVRRVTKLTNLFLLRMLIKIAMLIIRTVDMDHITSKLAEGKKMEQKPPNSTHKEARKGRKKRIESL